MDQALLVGYWTGPGIGISSVCRTSLKEHGNEAGFCINRFGTGPLHNISSRSDFGFKFLEIFVIEK
jgi:hypothetical protein